MSQESRVKSHELATQTAALLVVNYDNDLGTEDMSRLTCRRPVDRPTLVSSLHHFDNFRNEPVYQLEVIDLRQEGRHLLKPIDWLNQADPDMYRALGNTGLCLMEAELQKAVSGLRPDIAADQWLPQTLTSGGEIIERMIS